MYCNKCGKQLDDGAAFCGGCGARADLQTNNEEMNSPILPPKASRCKNCNAPLEEGAAFCGECGLPLATPDKAELDNFKTQPITPEPDDEALADEKKKENLTPLIITLIVVLLLSAGAIYYFLFYKDLPAHVETPDIGQTAAPQEEWNNPSAAPSATPQASNYPAPDFEFVTASGVTQTTDTSKNYAPYLIKDGRPDTAWNVSGGVGEWVMLSSAADQKVNGIRILNGYTKYSTEYKMWVYYPNNRPKEITISFSDGTSVNKTLEDVFNEGDYIYQDIGFQEPKITKYIKITVDSIYKGESWDDTCISEVQAY